MTQLDACREITVLYQNEIKRKGLVSSGKLYKSFRCVPNGDSFSIISEDYFMFLDTKHRITEDITKSKPFKDILEKYLATVTEKLLATIK